MIRIRKAIVATFDRYSVMRNRTKLATEAYVSVSVVSNHGSVCWYLVQIAQVILHGNPRPRLAEAPCIARVACTDMSKRSDSGRANDRIVGAICMPANPRPDDGDATCED